VEHPADDPAVVGDHGFREAMSRLPVGVVIVTCRVEGRAWGTTVSSCSSVSLEPPVLAVALTRGTVTATEIERAGAFGVSVLGAGLVELARFGSVRGQAKFMDDRCLPGDTPAPAVTGAVAHCSCAVEQALDVGDHRLLLGRVTGTLVQSPERPLVYYARDYHRLGGRADSAMEETVESLLYPHPMPRQFTPPGRRHEEAQHQ
jgi:flavin reductase (DIM6/NTAB) family NADH-FMN oxidoreductase RutF